LIEFFGRAPDATRSFCRQSRDNVFHLNRLVRQRTLRAFPSSLFGLPTGCDETIKALLKLELCLDRIMSEIVNRKKKRVIALLFLPRFRAIIADAPEKSAAIRALGELDDQGQPLCT